MHLPLLGCALMQVRAQGEAAQRASRATTIEMNIP